MESYTLPNLLELLWSFSLESCLLMSTVANLSLREYFLCSALTLKSLLS